MAAEDPELQQTTDVVLTEAERRARRQDFVRAGITGCFLLLILVLIVFGCIGALHGVTAWTQTKELLQIFLPAITGLLGSSLGFYFGSRTRELDAGDDS